MQFSRQPHGHFNPSWLPDLQRLPGRQELECERVKRLMVMVGALALVVAACSSSGGSGVATLEDPGSGVTDTGVDGSGTAPSELTDEEALIAFAACMRDNGVEGFEDPTVASDGSVEFGFGPGGGDEQPFGDVDRETVRAAFDACSDELGGLAIGPGGENFDQGSFEDTFVEFAACMRENGVQMDDPDFSNFGPGQGGGAGDGSGGGGPFGDIDRNDPTVQAALSACQDIFGGVLPGGPGRGPGGGGQGSGGGA